jgi:hypothetical protein
MIMRGAPVDQSMMELPFALRSQRSVFTPGLALKFSDHNICPTWLTKPLTALTVGQVSNSAQALQGRLVDTPVDLPKITSKTFCIFATVGLGAFDES